MLNIDRYALGDAIRLSYLKHGNNSWLSIADDVALLVNNQTGTASEEITTQQVLRLATAPEIILAGEPYFILRAKDPLALAALMVWIEKAEKFGATEEAVKAAWAIVADFQRWQQKNGTEVP